MYVYISLTLSLCVYHICVYRIKFMFVVPLNVSFKCVSSSLRRTYHRLNETELKQKSCKTANRVPQSQYMLHLVGISKYYFCSFLIVFLLKCTIYLRFIKLCLSSSSIHAIVLQFDSIHSSIFK